MLRRLLKHLSSPGWWARRAFRADDLAAIGAAVKASEAKQRGEIRIAIEGPLPLRALLRNESSRDRAASLFQSLGVAATREANGILIYVQLVDHQVEILADRGISAHVPPAEWDAICRRMETAFAADNYQTGMVDAIKRITALLAQHFPATGDNPNELDDAPTLL
ncbi:MAG: TPM domain-containing protein [Ferribacterium limneticum]